MKTNKIAIVLSAVLLVLSACAPVTSSPAPGQEPVNPPPSATPPAQVETSPTMPTDTAPTPAAVPAKPPADAVVPPALAAFRTSGLTVKPAMVKLGELAMVNVIVTNTGGQPGNYTVVLKVDGSVVKTQAVTLAGGASQNVTFPLSSGFFGTHVLTVGENSCNLTVQQSAPEMPGKSGDCAVMP